MQVFKRKLGGSGIAAPVVCSALAAKELCQKLRMHRAMATDCFEDLPLKLRQLSNPSAMHELPEVSGQKAIRVEKILLKLERSVTPLKLAVTITLNSLAKDKVVGPGGRSNGIGLYKAEPIKRRSQSGRAKEGMRYRISAELMYGRPHSRSF